MLNDQQHSLLGVLIAFTVLTCITVGLRCYVRIWLVKSVGIDDWFMLASLIGFVLLCSLLIVGVHYGLGQHAALLQPADAIQAAKIIYIFDSGLIKCSVGLLLLRLFSTKPPYRYIIIGSIGVVAVWTLVTFLIVAFQCRPLSLAWNPFGKGTCMPAIEITRLGYAFSALDIASDFLYALLPIPILYEVQLSWQVKASVSFVLSLGILTSAATIVRLKHLIALTDEQDVLFTICVSQMWSVLECGIGITAGSIASLRPLMRYIHISGFTSNGGEPSQELSNLQSSKANANKLGYIRQKDIIGQRIVRNKATENDNGSQELILEQHQIHKKTDIDISYQS
ncbi:hypothetical protein F5884DRAFT_858199 [Xylogone sp. PMI_703]|nr:hypothetical protein F5884DRAFT_858199 [Xylogone sp. PMI_703]